MLDPFSWVCTWALQAKMVNLSGFLAPQTGYDPGDPKRAIVRSYRREYVPDGFDVNPQFQLVVEPAQKVDEPLLYTDEDWIPHSAGFVAGLTALRNKKRFEA